MFLGMARSQDSYRGPRRNTEKSRALPAQIGSPSPPSPPSHPLHTPRSAIGLALAALAISLAEPFLPQGFIIVAISAGYLALLMIGWLCWPEFLTLSGVFKNRTFTLREIPRDFWFVIFLAVPNFAIPTYLLAGYIKAAAKPTFDLVATFGYHGVNDFDAQTVSITYSLANNGGNSMILDNIPIAVIVVSHPSNVAVPEDQHIEGRVIYSLLPRDLRSCYDVDPTTAGSLSSVRGKNSSPIGSERSVSFVWPTSVTEKATTIDLPLTVSTKGTVSFTASYDLREISRQDNNALVICPGVHLTDVFGKRVAAFCRGAIVIKQGPLIHYEYVEEAAKIADGNLSHNCRVSSSINTN
jgi:hypothetical protein